MKNKLESPKTLQEAIGYFSDPERCFQYAVSFRWPDGKVTCPRCGSQEHSFISTRKIWFCKGCKRQFTVKVGTIFEDSPLGMDKWMTAMWLVVNCKNGISSCEVARSLGITQKSAWFMVHRLRLALQDKDGGKLGGEVEVDETYIGGLSRNMHASKRRARITGTGGMDKVAVLGILKRGGKVRSSVIGKTDMDTLHGKVHANVEKGSELFTDAWQSYTGLIRDFKHQVIDHAKAYAIENVHTNGLENYWSLLKRTIKGTYVSVEPFHLFRYLDEQAFRYNNREDMNDSDRFTSAMMHVAGRRLTWDKLTGKEPTARPN
jgi:transposase-like protein/IS1 family transposase